MADFTTLSPAEQTRQLGKPEGGLGVFGAVGMSHTEGDVALGFKQLEQVGWDSKAASYDDLLGQVTRGAASPLLDAVKIVPGMRMLDVATGPGYVAVGAVARGAEAVGIDFAPEMAALAGRLNPGLDFHQGDAERLDFADASFDAVVCAFGVLHFADPDRALAEAFRVLKPGARMAFTVWDGPKGHDFFEMVLRAIGTHGNMHVDLPPAPPIFRFADRGESARVLAAIGFVDSQVSVLPLQWRAPSAGAVLDAIYKSTVRTAMLLEHQAPEARERIHHAILTDAARHAQGDAFIIGWPAALVSARKPN